MEPELERELFEGSDDESGVPEMQNDTDSNFDYDREDYAFYGADTAGQSPPPPPPLREPEQIWQEEAAKYKSMYKQKCAELEVIKGERDDAKATVAAQEIEIGWLRYCSDDAKTPASPDSNPPNTQSSADRGTAEPTDTPSAPSAPPASTSSAASVSAAAATASTSPQPARRPKRPGLKRLGAKIGDVSPSDTKQAEPAAGGKFPQPTASTASQKREREGEQDATEPAPKRPHMSQFGPSASLDRASAAGQKRGREDEQDTSEPAPKRPAHQPTFGPSKFFNCGDDCNVFDMFGGGKQKHAGEDAKSPPTKRFAYAVPNSSSCIGQGSTPATSQGIAPSRSTLNESQFGEMPKLAGKEPRFNEEEDSQPADSQIKNIRLHKPTEPAFRSLAQKWMEGIKEGKKQKNLIENFPPTPWHRCIGPRCPEEQDKMPEARRRIHDIEEVYEALAPAGKLEEKLDWLRIQQTDWHWTKVAAHTGTEDEKQELTGRFHELFETIGGMVEQMKNKTQSRR